MPSLNISRDETKEFQTYAWNYFQLHAGQRMSVFNFYIFLAALMTTGLVTTFNVSFQAHYLGILLGALLSFISFVFWKLDERTRFLIRLSEDALKELEGTFKSPNNLKDPHPVQLFRFEEFATGNLPTRRILFWKNQLSYRNSFNLVYLVFSLLGIAGVAISILVAISD